ncbi:ArsC family reductase [Methylobacillus caricis]|uniref:ArsC family reductase n=1 Tax=Methylobacillus caricis TaxID=1971611 RepID=UPI001CFF9A5B|nr:ArsC family reductase [Methylobacillus caricis]MCB5187055.1 ArsC family reductase [Methylobacillus caricis]
MMLYGIPNCSTVKKARTWLDQQNITYEFHDFKKQGISEATLNQWLGQVEWEKLVNRAGMTWRGLEDSEKAAVTDAVSAARLMQEKTSVIKRPVLVDNGKILSLGFTEAAYTKLFGQ